MSINYRFVSILNFWSSFSPFLPFRTFGRIIFYGDRIVFTVNRRQRSTNLINLLQFGKSNILHDLNFHWNDMCRSRWRHVFVKQQPVLLTTAVKWICIAGCRKINSAPIWPMHRVHAAHVCIHLWLPPNHHSTASTHYVGASRPDGFEAAATIDRIDECVQPRSVRFLQCEIAPIKMQINLVMKIVEWFKYCVACYTANPINECV